MKRALPCEQLCSEGASVKKHVADLRDAGSRRKRQSGFSIVELLVVCVIAMVVMAMAMLQMQPTWQQFQANAGFDEVKATLHQARETAISQRRTIVVKFLTTGTPPCIASGNVQNCISLTQMVVTAGTPPTVALAANPFLVVPIQNNVQFISFAGEPDTPDAFIGVAPTVPNGVYVGATAGPPVGGVLFQSEGTLTNVAGTPINLTLFLGVNNIPTTARCVTILGNTGRVSPYRGTGKAWFR